MLAPHMRRAVAIGILAILLISTLSVIDDPAKENTDDGIMPMAEPRLIDESEMSLGQIEALNSVGMGRGANTNWSAAGGSGQTDEIYEMLLDSNGDIIICGTIYQISQFGSIQVHTEGEGDILIAKLSKAGVWQWAVSAGTAMFYDECRGITIDSNDNVYGTGYIRGDVNFGNHTVSSNGFDGYIAKVAPNGTWDWARKFGGIDIDVGWDLAADNYDNLYLTGYYQNLSEFDTVQLTTEGQSENARFFIAYYNFTANAFTWAKDSYGSGSAIPYQVVVEPSTNDVYIAGYHTGMETFGSWQSNPASVYAGFLLKYNDTGVFQWGEHIVGPTCPFGQNCGVYFNNIVLHPIDGVVIGGNYLVEYNANGSTYSAAGSWDVLVAWYRSNGMREWIYSAGGVADDRIQGLSINPKGEVQFGGNHFDDMTFSGTLLNKTTTTQKYDAFIAQVDADGNFQWALTFGGPDNDTVGALISLDDGTIISGGDFSGTVSFGNMPRSATGQDIFVWQFQHDKDDDGITDYTDNCLNTANPDQLNYDSDLQGDACDTDDDNDTLHDVLDDCSQGMMNWDQNNSSLDHDSDGCRDSDEDDDDDSDGVLDIDDNCPTGVIDWNPTNETDLDGDGCQDSDEDSDDDGDSHLDIDDNCPVVANSLQENYDNDTLGDICDPDDDGDTVVDPLDHCPMGAINWTSAQQTDKDGDGCEDEGSSNEDDDDDNDGVLDVDDQCPRGETGWNSTSSTDKDGDGCRNDNEDNDNDDDGFINEVDLCPTGITGWVRNGTNDNDGDGCLDDLEDDDDDNDGFSDVMDICPNQEGTAFLGGMRGCPDFDEDGWADSADAFFQDETQWSDGDGDGFGDNPSGDNADDCPFFAGNSSADRIGCIDFDGDGYSNPDLVWTVIHGADAFVNESTQWSDTDGDGYGDNFEGVDVDYCTDEPGTSTQDRFGCPDPDGDGWSNADAFWNENKWDSLGFGPDMFPYEATQWYDSDSDGYGDNWGDSTWNDSRQEDWPGVFILGAIDADMCPLEINEGSFFDDAQPGCIPDENFGIDNNNDNNDGAGSGEDSGSNTMMIIGIVAGLVVLSLVGFIVVLMNKPKKKAVRKTPKPLTEIPAPGSLASPSPPEEVEVEEDAPSDSDTVGSWEDLPDGAYLDPDESGTVWYEDTNGNHWYQNPDETWSKWTE